MKVNLLKRAFPLQRGVEHIERARIPASARWIAEEWLPLLAYNAPDLTFERHTLMGVKQIKQFQISGSTLHATASNVGTGVETFDHGQDLLRPVGVDKIDRPLVVEKRMA